MQMSGPYIVKLMKCEMFLFISTKFTHCSQSNETFLTGVSHILANILDFATTCAVHISFFSWQSITSLYQYHLSLKLGL